MPDSFRYTEEHPYIGKGLGRNAKEGKTYTEVEADVTEFEDLFADKDVDRITTAGTDGNLEPIEDRPDFLIPEEDFGSFVDWYLHFAEKRELLGSTNHLLYICRKHLNVSIGEPSVCEG